MRNSKRRVTWLLVAIATIMMIPILESGCAEATEPEPEPRTGLRLQRPVGIFEYTLTLHTVGPDETETRTAYFQFETQENGQEWIRLRRVESQVAGGEVEEEPLDEACRERFGGDEEFLAVMPVQGGQDLSERMPDCIPENLYVILADIVSFFVVHSEPDFGVGELNEVGQSVASKGFETTAYDVGMISELRITCAGGEVTLKTLDAGVAVIGWKPEDFDIAMIQEINESFRILMLGTEVFEIEMAVDPRTGELLSGRSLVDEVELKMWAPYQGTHLPEGNTGPGPATGSISVTRTLELRRLDGLPE